MKSLSVIINADMGESYGKFTMGRDEDLMPHVTSANLACGFHGGDPVVMGTTVRLAKSHGVSIGAHPGLEDLRGFGRRRMNISPQELYGDVLYQLGALGAFVRAEGASMTHVCPHGLMDPMVSDEAEYAEAFMKAIKDYDENLVMVLEAKSLLYKKALAEGLKVASVAYPDLKYDGRGNMIIEGGAKKPVDPQKIAMQCVSIVKHGELLTETGESVSVKAEVLGFHGDLPNITEVLTVVRKTLTDEGIEIRGF